MNVGMIGLGIMGRPMAKNLLKAGHRLWVHDIHPAAVRELCALGAEAAAPKDMGARCEALLTILPTGKIVQQVLLGEGGALAGMAKGSLVMDMSSVMPGEARACARACEDVGVDFLDAPVSGGEPKAIDGSLAFMVGGSRAAFDRAGPLFDAMGHSAVLVGDAGAGCVAKLANQIIVNLGIAAVSEALSLAVKAGADPEKVYQAIRGGLAGSAVLDAKAPMMLRRDFKAGGKIAINYKDIGNVMDTAHQLGMPLPLSAQLMEIMKELISHGQLEEDHGSIVKYYERAGGVTVRSEEAAK